MGGGVCPFVLSVQKVAIVILVQGMKLRSKDVKGGKNENIGKASQGSVLLQI